MSLTAQRRLAAAVLKCAPDRVRFKTDSLGAVKDAITKADIRGLIKKGLVTKKPVRGISRGRARKTAQQKHKGRQRGHGSRKGRQTARLRPKSVWMSKVRLQRAVLQSMKESKTLDVAAYKELYKKVKGGFFRNRRHLLLYIEEHGLKP